MIIPIRCQTCGKPIAHLWGEYKEMVKDGKGKKEALDELELERYCCRTTFLGHVDMLDLVARYK